jgi:biopolymer transport protein ExbB/TolQ
MGILTILLLIILAMGVCRFIQISKNNYEHATTFRHHLTLIKSLGLFALVFGIFGQLLGLYQAFSVIEQAGSISPAILAGGLKVSTIPTLYGMIIFLLSYLIWLGLDYKASNKSH